MVQSQYDGIFREALAFTKTLVSSNSLQPEFKKDLVDQIKYADDFHYNYLNKLNTQKISFKEFGDLMGSFGTYETPKPLAEPSQNRPRPSNSLP